MGIRNGPISQVDIENEMLRLVDMLEEETEAFEKLAEDAAKKEAIYKANWAKEYLSAKGSIIANNCGSLLMQSISKST